MTTSTVEYEGNLKVKCTHTQSETQIESTAPTDNQGDGTSFSPTDLLATSLAACAIVTLGIKARMRNLDIGKPKASVLKIMANKPRRIDAVEITVVFDKPFADDEILFIKETTENCPVALSLQPSLRQSFKFIFGE